MFLHSKSEAYSTFKKLAKRLQNSFCNNIGAIKSDHGGKFQNEKQPILRNNRLKICNNVNFLKSGGFPEISQKKTSLGKLIKVYLQG